MTGAKMADARDPVAETPENTGKSDVFSVVGLLS